jgi:long-subunit fatty acid transport protein
MRHSARPGAKSRRRCRGACSATVATISAHAGGLFLYEMGTPDLGTGSAGRAAAADNAATAFGNPAGMTRYALNERATIGAAYEYLNLGDADLDRDRGSLAGRIEGNYSTNEIHFFNATLSWKF